MMRIIALTPEVTELIISLGGGSSLVGIPHNAVSDEPLNIAKITRPPSPKSPVSAQQICPSELMISEIKALKPDLIIGTIMLPREPKTPEDLSRAANEAALWVKANFGDSVQFHHYTPFSLNEVMASIEELGRALEKPLAIRALAASARERAQRVEAQLLDWGNNFYDRMRGKRVTVIWDLEPLTIAGLWVPELISLCSAHSQDNLRGRFPRVISWDAIVDFRPDVMLITPRGCTIEQSLKSFPIFEKKPHWEDLPCVKRGEVIFTEGLRNFIPTLHLGTSMGILVSAIAGLESGYITEKDSFFRLRWLELHRHRLAQ